MQAAHSPACRWCGGPIPPESRSDSDFCGKKCRQTAWRLRRRRTTDAIAATPKRIAYADPPYPGFARRYYGNEPTFAGEVDHAALIERLRGFDGWALSTSGRLATLRALEPHLPPEARLAPWIKPGGIPPSTIGPHNRWEAVIYVPARELQGARVADCLVAHAARGGGTLIGRKPLEFCAWLFRLLGAMPGDSLEDLFPGTGIVGRSWREWSVAGVLGDASRSAEDAQAAVAAVASRAELEDDGA